jgi:hypothetical protein
LGRNDAASVIGLMAVMPAHQQSIILLN